MEWVEITAKTVEAAREAALDQLGVALDEAEIDVVEEPRPGLFGRTRGQARVRARVKPTPVRPKQERRRRSKSDKPKADASPPESSQSDAKPAKKPAKKTAAKKTSAKKTGAKKTDDVAAAASSDGASNDGDSANTSRGNRRDNSQEKRMSNDDRPQSDVTPQEVGDAAVAFMDGLTEAFGATGSTTLTIDDTELDVQVNGEELGLLVGPSGRTLNAIQDLVRVAAQRRLGDHETRLRIDVASYRERRSAALSRFAADVAQQVRDTGEARSLEPMTSADRKVIHDALNEEDGVQSSSTGEDPYRRVVVEPA